MYKFLGLLFTLLFVIGYVSNIVKMFTETVAGMAIARGIGIFALPLGAILGYF